MNREREFRTKAKELAQENGIPFIINPAPHQPVPEGLFDGVDYLTPNETECEYFSGIRVTDETSAEAAAEKILLEDPHLTSQQGRQIAHHMKLLEASTGNHDVL